MFLLAVQKDAMVENLGNWVREEGGWSPTFLRSFNDWEMEKVQRFLSSIHRNKIRPWIENKILLKGSSHGNFSVMTLYSGLDLSPETEFPFCSIWNYVIPSKISFFAWEASWGKAITLDQLKRRGGALANRCCLYEEDEETIDHMLIYCKMAKMLWDLFFYHSWD